MKKKIINETKIFFEEHANRMYGYFSWVLYVGGFEDDLEVKHILTLNNLKKTKLGISFKEQLKKRGSLQKILYEDNIKGFILGFIDSYLLMAQLETALQIKKKLSNKMIQSIQENIKVWTLEKIYLTDKKDIKKIRQDMSDQWLKAITATDTKNFKSNDYYYSFFDNPLEKLRRILKRYDEVGTEKNNYQKFFIEEKNKKNKVNLLFVQGYDLGFIEAAKVKEDFFHEKDHITTNNLNEEPNKFIQLLIRYKKNKEIHHDEFYWSEEAVNACKKRQIECYDINSNLLDSSYLDN